MIALPYFVASAIAAAFVTVAKLPGTARKR
jgi:hypothetical protein